VRVVETCVGTLRRSEYRSKAASWMSEAKTIASLADTHTLTLP
jgi:hypothetical protein